MPNNIITFFFVSELQPFPLAAPAFAPAVAAPQPQLHSNLTVQQKQQSLQSTLSCPFCPAAKLVYATYTALNRHLLLRHRRRI